MDLPHLGPSRRPMLCAALVALAVACAPAPPQAPAAPAQPAPAPAAPGPGVAAAPAPQAVAGTSKDAWYVDPVSLGYEAPAAKGGTFSYASNNGPLNLDPWGNNTRQRSFFDTAYDTVMARRLQPGKSPFAVDMFCRLCESWELSSDKLTLTFKLRQNVKFHDGKPLTSADVKFSIEKGADPKTGFEFRSLMAGMDRVEAPDPYTLRLVMKSPDADVIRYLNAYPIVPKHIFDDGGDLTKQVIGTGAFKMEKFDVDNQYAAVKNTDYWVPDRPYLDRMVAHFIGDKSQRQAAFLSKQIDNYTAGDINEMRPIQAAAKDAKVDNLGGSLVQVYYMNVQKPPLSDKRVRRAMHLALDRDEENKQLTDGLGVPYLVAGSPSGWQPHTLTQEDLAKMPGFRKPKDQDLAEAKRLLTEAGYPNGFKMTSTHIATYTSNPEWNEASSAQMKRIGIDITLDPVEVGIGLQRFGECGFDMFVRPSAGGESMITRNYRRWITGGSENICKYSNPEYDKLVEQQAAEFDVAKRWEIVKKIQLMLMEEVPALAMSEIASFAAYHPHLHNWRNFGHSFSMPWNPNAELIWVQK